MRRWVVLDRDGTLIEERPYLSDPQQVRLLPRAAQAVHQLRRLGFPVVIITNQSGISRGYFGQDTLQRIHARLLRLLAVDGATVDGLYYCPHAPADGCHCRKPEPGLLRRAARDLGLRPEDAFVVGDKECDIELALRAGATPMLVRTGWGRQTAATAQVHPRFLVADLWQASQVIASLVEVSPVMRG